MAQTALFPLTQLPEGKMHPSALNACARTDRPVWSCFPTQPLINSMYSPHHQFPGFPWTLSLLNHKVWGQGRLTHLHVSGLTISAPRALTMNRWLSLCLPAKLSPHHRQMVPVDLHPSKLEAPAMTIITECFLCARQREGHTHIQNSSALKRLLEARKEATGWDSGSLEQDAQHMKRITRCCNIPRWTAEMQAHTGRSHETCPRTCWWPLRSSVSQPWTKQHL